MTTFHRWFDRMDEPWRLLTAILLIMPGIYALSWAFVPSAIRLAATIWLAVLVATRIVYVYRNR